MAWTKVANPTADSWTKVPNAVFSSVEGGDVGIPIGLLMAITYTDSSIVVVDPWNKVANPTTQAWTKVPNAS